MSILKLFRGNKLNIDQTPVTDGQMYLSKDTNELIVDTDDGRVTVQDGRVSGKLDRIEGTDSVQKVYAVDTNGTQIMKAVVDDSEDVSADVPGLVTANAVAGVADGKVNKSGDIMTGNLVLRSTDNNLSLNVFNTLDGSNYHTMLITEKHTDGTPVGQVALFDENNDTVNYMNLYAFNTQFYKPVAINSGGTGATTADGARAALNAAKKPEARNHSTFACISNGNEISREISDTLDYQVDSYNYATIPTTKLVSDSIDGMWTNSSPTKADKIQNLFPTSSTYKNAQNACVVGSEWSDTGYVKIADNGGDNEKYIARMKAVRDEMFQSFTAIPQNADLDTYTTPGHYNSPSGTVTGTLTNIPSEYVSGFDLYVNRLVGSNNESVVLEQRTIQHTDGVEYRRKKQDANSWSDWEHVRVSATYVSNKLDTKQNKLPTTTDYTSITGVLGYSAYHNEWHLRSIVSTATGSDLDVMTRAGVQAMIDAALQNYVQKTTTPPSEAADAYSVYGVDPSGNQCMVAIEKFGE